MAEEKRNFTCVIDDRILHERFSATITVRKKAPIRSSLQAGKIDLADIFIAPVSGAPTLRIHHHFVLYNFTGHGRYIVRDARNRDEQKIQCTIWDLGVSFASQVMDALKDLA